MKYFLFPLQENNPRTPFGVTAMLHEEFIPKGYNVGMGYDWNTSSWSVIEGDNPFGFPDTLYLISKQRKQSFDCFNYASGLIVSKDFKDLLSEKDLQNFKIADLVVCNGKGENISDKQMFYMKQIPKIHLEDALKSDYSLIGPYDYRPAFMVTEELFNEYRSRKMVGATFVPEHLLQQCYNAMRERGTFASVPGIFTH